MADGLHCPLRSRITHAHPEDAMAKGQMRSNKEKKKPKKDKNQQKGGAAPSPFGNMHSQSKPGSSYSGQYGKKG
jgi:hypothetical protein